MKVLADRVVILPDAPERKTSTGLYLPATVTSTDGDFITGRVVAIGGGRLSDRGVVIPCEVEVGQRVYYNRHAAHEVEVANVLHHQVRDNDCVAVISE